MFKTIAAIILIAGAAQAESMPGAPLVSVTVPTELSANEAIGKAAFDGLCATCHGPNAAGREGFGPPLIHQYYVPGHHGDNAFFLAAQNGVRSHHWNFGDMPPVRGATRADVASIIAYVRRVQQENGIR